MPPEGLGAGLWLHRAFIIAQPVDNQVTNCLLQWLVPVSSSIDGAKDPICFTLRGTSNFASAFDNLITNWLRFAQLLLVYYTLGLLHFAIATLSCIDDPKGSPASFSAHYFASLAPNKQIMSFTFAYSFSYTQRTISKLRLRSELFFTINKQNMSFTSLCSGNKNHPADCLFPES